jgi:LysM repeat protein
MLGLKIDVPNLKSTKNNMKKLLYLFPLFVFSGCVNQLLSKTVKQDSVSTLESLHELRSEVAHLNHILNGQSVDIQLLEEKVSSLSLKKRELLTESVETIQHKVDQIESVLANMRMHVEQGKKQTQAVFEGQLQRLISLENKVTQQESSLHIVKDLKNMMNQIKPSFQNYKIESGDTLEGISKRFGLKISELKGINQLDSDQIQVGQTLKIPL